jgi:hypothetical protein
VSQGFSEYQKRGSEPRKPTITISVSETRKPTAPKIVIEPRMPSGPYVQSESTPLIISEVVSEPRT